MIDVHEGTILQTCTNVILIVVFELSSIAYASSHVVSFILRWRVELQLVRHRVDTIHHLHTALLLVLCRCVSATIVVWLSQLSLIVDVACWRDILLAGVRWCFQIQVCGAVLVIVSIVSAVHWGGVQGMLIKFVVNVWIAIFHAWSIQIIVIIFLRSSSHASTT